MTPEGLARAAEWLADAERVVASTGAGMSRESGIPTFRDAMEGLWARFDPQELATEAGFRKNPRRVFDCSATRNLRGHSVKDRCRHRDAIDCFESLSTEFYSRCHNVVIQLARPTRSDNCRCDFGATEDPSECELCESKAESFRNRLELLNRGERAIAHQIRIHELVHLRVDGA